jgi:hypothetical protein
MFHQTVGSQHTIQRLQDSPMTADMWRGKAMILSIYFYAKMADK